MYCPIVRIAKEEYLDDLQNGNLFMRNVLYYQRMESSDIVRSDPFDGAIPAPGFVPQCLKNDSILTELNPKFGKFMRFDVYVSCFFGISPSQILPSGNVIFSEEIANELENFNCEDALVIDLNRLSKRLEKNPNFEENNLAYGNVKYLSNEEYESELNCLKNWNPPSVPIEFLKRELFSKQQEFRISYFKRRIFPTPCDESSSSPYTLISPEMNVEIANSTITLDIGSIRDFSWKVKLKNLLEGKIRVYITRTN